MSNRDIMLSALMEHTVPLLTEKGFTGKYPSFRRKLSNCIELISFQTNKYGGSFAVEVSAVFPASTNKNYVPWDGVTEENICVEHTNERYRLPGMFDGWFYYRDVYRKRTLFFGNVYHEVPEKNSADFVPSKGYRLVHRFDKDTAVQICEEINSQLTKAYRWLERFERTQKA